MLAFWGKIPFTIGTGKYFGSITQLCAFSSKCFLEYRWDFQITKYKHKDTQHDKIQYKYGNEHNLIGECIFQICPMLENHRNIKDMIWNTLDNWPTYKDVLLVILQAARLYMFPEMLFWQWYDRDYYLTTIIRNPQKAGLSSVFNGFRKVQRSWLFSLKTVHPLKTQHFIS